MASLAAFRNREFRLYWGALVLSAVGTWIQIVAQSLLVLRLSHGSAVSLGYVAIAQASAFFLFALVGGSMADRIDRRRLLLLTQAILMLVAFVVGVLVARQTVQVWMIVAAAFVSGSVLSFDQPARSAFLPSLVDERDLMSAISLQSTVFLGAAALAPVLAGLSIERFGLAGSFFLNSASYLAVIFVLLMLRPAQAKPERIAGKMLESIRAGIETVRRDRGLTWAVSGYAVLLFVAPSMQILLPVLVDRVLHSTAHSKAMVLGLLFAAFGAGSVVGALLVSWLGGLVPAHRLYLGSFSIWVVAMSVVAFTREPVVYFGALLLLGGAQNAINVLTMTLLQSRVVKEMRGRMMSLQTLLNMGVRPLGDFPVSVLIGGLGASMVAGLSAALVGAFGVYLAGTRGRLSRG